MLPTQIHQILFFYKQYLQKKQKKQSTIKPTNHKIMQPAQQTHDLRKEISQLLNFQYKTNLFSLSHTFRELVAICEKALRTNIYRVLYQVVCTDLWKYGIKLEWCEEDPFEKEERVFLGELADVCEKIIQDPEYKHIDVVNKYVKQGKLGNLQLTKFYKRFQQNFIYINIKQALVFSALSQCNVWYTICKSRKKSKKQFDLDPLIEYFNNLVNRLKLQNPYHLDILPKKQVKSINKKTDQQKKTNPLFQAVSNGEHQLAKELLLKGAKIETVSFLNTRQRMQVRSSHRACLNGDLKMCKLLDSFGCNWQAEDSQKMTPIFYAIQSSNMSVIKYLVQQIKVNIQKQDIQSRTPFYWATTQGDIDILDYFYKAGCNINHKSELGRTALSKSCYLGRRDIVMYLLKLKEIDMFSQCKKGRTALHNAVFGPKGGREGHKFGTNEKDSPQCAQILLENGMDVDMLDFQFCTALHVAMSSQAIDSIKLLLAYGASLTAKNNYQQTPLMTGAKFGHVESCRILYQQYHADILCVDIYNKNLLLLTAKFQQNSQDGNINPVYLYFLQPFILECLKQNKIQQLHRTFKQIINSEFCGKMILELVSLWNGFKKYKVPTPQFGITQIQNILKISIGQTKNPKPHQPQPQQNLQPQQCREFAIDVFREINLPEQKLKQIHLWLLKYNQIKILQFLHEHQLLHLDNIKLSGEEFMKLLENDELGIKEKVISFCILSIGFDWVGYRSKDNTNILHVLVRKQRSGCIVQLFKALSGKIPPKILTNPYIQNASAQEQKKILQQLLWQKDQSGLDAHQLSLVLKNKSVAKLIEQKLKQQHLQFCSVLDIKQYAPILETDPKQLQLFNNHQHERQDILSKFQQKIINMNENEIMAWWGFREYINKTLSQLKQEKAHHQAHEHFWKQIQNRPLHFIKSGEQLYLLKQLYEQPVIGIDIEYFTGEGITMISLFQLSSLKVDYIIDCLNVDLRLIKSYLEPILYNENILKIMHGADNDLVLIKSLFNLSVINFVDTSRLDVELRENKYDLRGLATLARQYLGATMSKEYQVSQWKIRPLPKAMLQYAKKDSMILPYLLADMLDRIKDDVEKIRQFVLGGCKQSRRNKKASQPLIKGLKIV